MVFRFLIRFFSNNEQLVQRLSESYPIRRAAQLAVQAFNRGRQITEDSGIKDNINSEKFKSYVGKLTENVKNSMNEMRKRR